jgi:hypothetical protein
MMIIDNYLLIIKYISINLMYLIILLSILAKEIKKYSFKLV